MPKYRVTMHGVGIDDQPNAVALVEAADPEEAHRLGVRLIRQQYPDADPELYNLTMVTEIIWRAPTDS